MAKYIFLLARMFGHCLENVAEMLEMLGLEIALVLAVNVAINRRMDRLCFFAFELLVLFYFQLKSCYLQSDLILAMPLMDELGVKVS